MDQYVTQDFIPLRSEDRRQSWMRQMRENEYVEAFLLIELTAKSGDNIGIGEIPTLDFFTTIMQKAVAVGLYDDNKTLKDLIIVKPYHVTRHVTPALCQIILASRDHPSEEEHLRHLVRVACELAQREECGGYKIFVLEVFAYCLPHIQAFTLEGFHSTCVIPYAGHLAGHSGYVMSYIMYKEINAASPNTDQIRSVRSLPILRPLEILPIYNFKPNLLTGPGFLPMKYRCTTGMDIIVRYLQPEELPKFYAALMTATDLGYGVDEMPTYEIFLQIRVNNFYNFVAEDVQTKNAVAYFNVGPSPCTRCRTQNILANGNLVLLSQYRRQRLGRDMIQLISFFAASCGFEHIVGRMAITNIAVVKCSVQQCLCIVGALPKSIYFTKTGWTDLLIPYTKLPQTAQDSSVAAFIARARL